MPTKTAKIAKIAKTAKTNKPVVLCFDCEKPSVWMRATQFSGDHYFCEVHAPAEKAKDIAKSSDSYWVRV